MAIMGSGNTVALTFGILGYIISYLVYLAPMSTFLRIFKKKSTESFQSLPYLVSLFSSMIWLYYAYLKPNVVRLIIISLVGCVLEIIYIIMYIIYAPKNARSLTIKLFIVMNVGSFTLVFLISQFAIPGSLRAEIVGWICVFISVSVYAAPLSIVPQVIRTTSVEFMPFWLSFFLTLNAIMWFAYGVFLKDICIAISNLLGFTLGLMQISLYAIYKIREIRKKDVTEREQALESMRNDGVWILVWTHEVFPLPVNDDDENKHEKVGEFGAKQMENSLEMKECPV